MQRRYFVTGRVQGVGFRWSCVNAAKEIGVVGWTRNLADGRVEVLAHASAEQHERLKVWLEKGPTGANVEHVEVVNEANEPGELPTEFEIRRSSAR